MQTTVPHATRPSAASRRLHACEDTTPTPSPRLHANILLAYLVSFREADKRPEDATTRAEIIELYQQQGRTSLAGGS